MPIHILMSIVEIRIILYFLLLFHVLAFASSLFFPFPKVQDYNYQQDKELPIYYHEDNEQLFTTRALIRQGKLRKKSDRHIAVYDAGGELEQTANSIDELKLDGYSKVGIQTAANKETKYKQKHFRYFYDDNYLEQIDVPFICYIDEIPFNSIAEMARYLGVTNQATSSARQRRQK